MADLVGLRGLLLVTEFSLRLGVGWGSTCAGVKVCRKLLDPSLWAGGIPWTPAPRPPNTHACWCHSGAGLLRPSRRSQLVGCVTREGHSPSQGLGHLILKK